VKRLLNWINLIRKPTIKMALQVSFWASYWIPFEAYVLTNEGLSVNELVRCFVSMLVVVICLIPANYRVLVGDIKPGRRKKVVEKVETEVVPDNRPVEM